MNEENAYFFRQKGLKWFMRRFVQFEENIL